MQHTRSFLVTSLGWLCLACTPASATDDPVAQLVDASRDGNAALMRGDIDRYRDHISIADDFMLMSPFGGTPSGKPDEAGMQRMGRFFADGTFAQEVVHTYQSADMVVLATIERAHVAVGGLAAQPWALRVTQVYRREGTRWLLVHRHADPLVAGITLPQAAALGRGERGQGG